MEHDEIKTTDKNYGTATIITTTTSLEDDMEKGSDGSDGGGDASSSLSSLSIKKSSQLQNESQRLICNNLQKLEIEQDTSKKQQQQQQQHDESSSSLLSFFVFFSKDNMRKMEWIGQTIASLSWIISVFVYGIASVGDWLQLCAASAWFLANMAAAVSWEWTEISSTNVCFSSSQLLQRVNERIIWEIMFLQ